MLEAGYYIRTVHELLGHQDVRTTMIYTHVLNRGGRGVQSPADRLAGCRYRVSPPGGGGLSGNLEKTQGGNKSLNGLDNRS